MINYTFIIPHHNIPDLLNRCVESIPQRDDIQIVVVDDKSDGDKMPQISRPDVEIYYINKEESRGAGHARNIGLSHANGKWLIFADSDDFFENGFIDVIDKFLYDESEVIYFNIKSCDCYNTDIIIQDKRLSRFEQYEKTHDNSFFRLAFAEPWSKMVLRDFVVNNKILFQETRAHNDLLFGVKVGVLAKKIKTINIPIYWYVHRSGSTGRSLGNEPYEKVRDRVLAWNEVQNFLIQNGLEPSIYLPVKPCLKVFRHDFFTYCKLILFMKENNMKYLSVIYLTIKYSISILFGGTGPGFAEFVNLERLKQ